MTPVLIVIFVVTLVIAGMLMHLRPVGPAAIPERSPRRISPKPVAARPATPLKAHKPVPKARAEAPAALPDLAWDAPVTDATKPRAPALLAAVPVAGDPRSAQRARIRDRYLAARFPGVARTAADLLEAERVIHAARLYFEECKSDRALELLGLAVAQCPKDESLPLAQLEIAFLTQDPALYVGLATRFHDAHPASAHWSEVGRLGRALAPGDALFGDAGGPRDTDHYGPWPDMPNWIQAPWDLTAEVRATEFHQAMARRAA
jgi:hypothetical protein